MDPRTQFSFRQAAPQDLASDVAAPDSALAFVGWEIIRSAMDRQAQHLTRIVDELLDVSRITQGKISLAASSDGPREGSEFVVRLPALPSDAALEPRPETEPAVGQAGCKRILVVDDNVDSAQALEMLLEIGGHQIRTAYDGFQALEAAGQFKPEVVILDIGLPGMDGYEVARRLRSRPEFEKTLLIAMTGYGQEEDRRRAKEAGFDHHLVKPASLDALLALVGSGDPRER